MEELEAFLQKSDEKTVLLFPPLPSRLRYLIHRTAESFDSLSTFSVGEGWSRRAVVCHAHLRLVLDDSVDTDSSLYDRSPVATKSADPLKNNQLLEGRQTRRKKRPDKAVYICKAMRDKTAQGIQSDGAKAVSKNKLDSSGASLSTSEDSFAETEGLPDHGLKCTADCNRNAHTENIAKTSHDAASAGIDKSPSELEALLPSARLNHKNWVPAWDQTVSYFVALSIDDQQEDRSNTTYHPTCKPQVETTEDIRVVINEITANLKEPDITIESAQNEYSCYTNVWIDPEEFGHVIEIYDFPAVLTTEDLLDAFAEFSKGGLKIKWVDNTHALGVFSSQSAALQALTIQHPLLKTRALSEASKKSKGKALRGAEFIQPVKERPRTDTEAARRMVTRALGLQKRSVRS
ncbi:R3HC1 protein, partial [Atractosteus spatula]|nr:R3HC1 protein [Atractosteus spatula]